MSADNYIAIIKEGSRKWVGYHACASVDYPFSDCYKCLSTPKLFEETTELRALHKAQELSGEIYFEYGYTFPIDNWLSKKDKEVLCPCGEKKFYDKWGKEVL